MQFANEIITHHVHRSRWSSFPCHGGSPQHHASIRQYTLWLLEFNCCSANEIIALLYPIPFFPLSLPMREYTGLHACAHMHVARTAPMLHPPCSSRKLFGNFGHEQPTRRSAVGKLGVNFMQIRKGWQGREWPWTRLNPPRCCARGAMTRPLSTVVGVLSAIGWITDRSYKVIFFFERLPGDGRCIGSR